MRLSRMTTWMMAALLMAVFAAGAGGQGVSEQGNPWVRVNLGKVTVQAEVVQTPERLYLGLSYRTALPEGRGMLFLMAQKEKQIFCMRGMRLPLDFIWISDGRVAGVTRNVPATFPGDLISPAPVTQVLEVPGGFADRHGIKTGDRVTWQ
jgi:uncharacterized membrane protein (UPF0127 family)